MGTKSPRLEKYIDWALTTFLSFVASYGVHLISGMSQNIQELNEKVAVVISTSANQDHRLDRLEKFVFKGKR